MFPFSIPWTQRELQRDLPRLTTTLPWSNDLELHPDNFDAEHFRLVQGISALLMALSSRDSCRISMAYQVLVASARDHFASQEARMLAKAFGGLEEHSDEHVELARRLAEVRMSHFSPYGSASHLGAMPFLERWLVPHLRFSDKRFTDFLAAHPPAPNEPAGTAEQDAGSGALPRSDEHQHA